MSTLLLLILYGLLVCLIPVKTTTTGERSAELKRILPQVFQVEKAAKSSSFNQLSDIPNHRLLNEKHLEKTRETVRYLVGQNVTDMIAQLSDLKYRHPDSEYVNYLTRTVLCQHHDTKHLTLPPEFKTKPGSFFTKEEIGGANIDEKLRQSREGALDPEFMLNWWRLDHRVSEHHNNWHTYYTWWGPIKDRQGELFVYMHQQMLARYHFERMAVGLPPVTAFGPGMGWDEPLAEGFNPDVKDKSFRASNMRIRDSILHSRDQHYLIRKTDVMSYVERLKIGIVRNYFEDPSGNRVEPTMNNIGCSTQANNGTVNKRLYGNIHNQGHTMISKMNDPDGRHNIDDGVMIDSRTAPRDPVFYRWHKFLDQYLFEEFRSHLPPYTETDLIMKGIEVGSVSIFHEKGPPAKSYENDTVNHLFTNMIEKQIVAIIDKKEQLIRKTLLHHFPFTYRFKVQNTNDKDAKLVFRVFLATAGYQEEELDKRRNDFVELDRFVRVIPGGSHAYQIVDRSSEQSAVLAAPTPTLREFQAGNFTSSQAPCGCGWPRELLIPRGTSAGMLADLFVLVTDWEKDAVMSGAELSDSVSLCGVRDEPYPDKRPMGFPFDRKLNFETLEEMVKIIPNSAKTEVKIKFLGYE